VPQTRRAAAPPIPSATIRLIREPLSSGGDAAVPPPGGERSLEVFMVQRHHQVDFASSALVFPGGKVDPSDRDPALRARCTGAGDCDDELLAYRVAAVRETFEESGVLVARARGARELVPAARAAEIDARWRGPLNDKQVQFGEIAAAEDLELAIDALVLFAHWITPEFMPKRFDTHFYLVAVPHDQAAAHDGWESVDSLWIEPMRALREGAAGRLSIIFPTRMQLEKLARATSVADAVARARASRVVPVLPTVGRGASGPVIRIPAEADYDITEAPLDDVR
jgi:8-oxo-dGTP pyrophosphatase MutT (NUDIX family)